MEALTTMLEFEDMLLKEWSNPDSDVADPIILIEDQNLSRRGPGGAMTYHISIISDQWPTDSTQEERQSTIKTVALKVNYKIGMHCTRYMGYTQTEAEENHLNIVFTHPEFDIDKPHDSVEGKIGN
jgi:hypothetical protein